MHTTTRGELTVSAQGPGAMAELGAGLVPYSPLGRGLLTGTLDLATLDPTLSADEQAVLDPLAGQVAGARY